MNKKRLNKLSLNILNIFHLEANSKKKNIIQTVSYPLNKPKVSNISSLFLHKKKNLNNQIHRTKNLNNKIGLISHKTKNIYSTKSTELIKSNKNGCIIVDFKGFIGQLLSQAQASSFP